MSCWDNGLLFGHLHPIGRRLPQPHAESRYPSIFRGVLRLIYALISCWERGARVFGFTTHERQVAELHRTLWHCLVSCTSPRSCPQSAANIYKRVLRAVSLVGFRFLRLLRSQRHLFITLSWSLKWNPRLRQVSKNNGETSTERDSD
jgi:hypothetical protein